MGFVEPTSTESVETALTAHLGCDDVVLVSSGLTALEVALIASGAGPGTVVACDALYPFAAMSVINVAARPVPFDLQPETQLPMWESVLKCRGEGATILILTSYFGRRVATAGLVAEAKAIGLLVIEDRAQCFGPHTESWLSILSFQAGKLLSCGFGGAIAIPRGVSADLVRRHVHLGWWPREKDQGTDWSSGWKDRVAGRSARLSPVAAEVLARQIHLVDATRRTLATSLSQLREAVKSVVGSDAFVPNADGVRLVSVHVRNADARDVVGGMLAARGVVWGRPVHPPVTEWPGLQKHWLEGKAALPGTRELLSSLILASLDSWEGASEGPL